MKRHSLAVFSGLFVLAVLTGFVFPGDSVFVIGGEYTLPPDQAVDGDVNALFARITVAEGAHVYGNLTSISSDLDLRGAIDGDILLIQSEARLRGSCKTGGSQHKLDVFNYIFLLPEIIHVDPETTG